MPPETLQSPQRTSNVVRRESGDIVVEKKNGTIQMIAHFENGKLTYKAESFARMYGAKVQAVIGQTADGEHESGEVISSIQVENLPSGLPAKVKNPPPKPPFNNLLGDQEAARVKWYFDYDVPQFVARYGVYLEPSPGGGVQMVRRPVFRVVSKIVDERYSGRVATREDRKAGPSSTEGGPVMQDYDVIQLPDGIIARRATVLTFTPEEARPRYQATAEPEETEE